MTCSPQESGMFIMIQGSIFGCFFYIAIQDHRSVEHYLYLISPGYDFFLVPFACRQQEASLRWNDPIYGAVVLIGMQVFVFWHLIVEHLYLHPHIGRITFQRG